MTESFFLIGFMFGLLFVVIIIELVKIIEKIKQRKRELLGWRQEIIDGLCNKDKIFYQKKLRDFDLRRLK